MDTGRVFGSAQTGSRTYVPLNGQIYSAPSYNQPNAPSPVASFFDQTFTGGFLNDTAFGVNKQYGSSTTANILGTVRPRNIALLACIKY